MPPSPNNDLTWPWAILLWLILGLLLAFLAYISSFFLLLVAVPVSLMLVPAILRHQRLLNRLIDQRPGESICTFARSFDFRRVDTWIIRAVFEELQPWTRASGRILPIRPEDDLADILFMDEVELDDLIITIASRAGRSVEEYYHKPLPKPLRTVADLVFFLVHQPKTQTVLP